MGIDKPSVYAIFSGGGVKGAAFVGAIKEAQKKVRFKAVGGTSAGAIVAALLAVGYDEHELQRALFDAPYVEFFKRRWFRFALNPSRGLFAPDPLLGWLRERIRDGARRKAPDFKRRPVTFADLHEIDGMLPLKIVATNVSSRNVEVFSHKTYPSTEIASAVLASCSFPLLFPPVAQATGKFVDGGVISNFPMWLFNEERQEPKSAHTPVLGFALTTETEDDAGVGYDAGASTSLPHQVYSIYQSILAAQDRVQERYLDVARLANVIRIPVTSGTFDGTQGDDERTALLNAGHRAASEYFDNVPAEMHKKILAKDEDYVAQARDHLVQDDLAGAISRIARAHLLHGGVAVDNGSLTKRRFVKHYVDLMTAAADPTKLAVLAEVLKAHLTALGKHPKRLVGIKKGNLLLAAKTAWLMETPLVLAKTDLSYKIGAPFDGNIEPDDSVLIVDDIASDGSILVSAIEQLRNQGALVLGVLTLIERKEGDARSKIEKLGCRLHAVCLVDDEDIRHLFEEERSFGLATTAMRAVR